MFPVILSIGPIVLYSYSLFIFAAVFWGLFVIWKRGNELHFEPEELFDVTINVLWWMFVAARVGYVVLWHSSFNGVGEWLNIFAKPGWYFPIGLIGGWWALKLAAKKKKWDVYQVADVLVTGLILAQGILALGAFVAGVGYGMPTNWFVGMNFPGVYDRRFPVQLVEMMIFLGGFAYLWWAEGVYRTFSWYKGNKSQAATGYLTGCYLIIWGLGSFLSAVFKTPTLVVAGVRLDLVVPVVMSMVGGWLLLRRSGIVANGLWKSILDYFGL